MWMPLCTLDYALLTSLFSSDRNWFHGTIVRPHPMYTNVYMTSVWLELNWCFITFPFKTSVVQIYEIWPHILLIIPKEKGGHFKHATYSLLISAYYLCIWKGICFFHYLYLIIQDCSLKHLAVHQENSLMHVTLIDVRHAVLVLISKSFPCFIFPKGGVWGCFKNKYRKYSSSIWLYLS